MDISISLISRVPRRYVPRSTCRSPSLAQELISPSQIGKTGATGQTLEEAKKINKSLSALGIVINALTDGKVRSSSLNRGVEELR
jgi:hypothetical protein